MVGRCFVRLLAFLSLHSRCVGRETLEQSCDSTADGEESSYIDESPVHLLQRDGKEHVYSPLAKDVPPCSPGWAKILSKLEPRTWQQRNPLMDGTGQANNLCIDGKVVPQFFLLGAQKAATTYFAASFYQSPGVVAANKEFHFFDEEKVYNRTGRWDAVLSAFPQCQQSMRQVSADCTPNYLRNPRGFAASQIQRSYGEQAQRIKFMVVIRNPLKRMYSAYIHGVNESWPSEEFSMSFEKLAEKAIRDSTNGSMTNLKTVEASRYADRLSEWFHVFAPPQFTIVPMLYIVHPYDLGANTTVHEHMWRVLGLPVPTQMWNFSPQNTGMGRSIEEATTPAVLGQLKEVLDTLTGPARLAELLHGSGASLFACDGCSREGTEHWIRRGWG